MRRTLLPQLLVQPAQTAIALVAARVHAAGGDGIADRAARLGEVLAVEEAAAGRTLRHLAEPERRGFEVVDGGREVAQAGRVHLASAALAVVQVRGRGGMAAFLLAHQLANG